MKNSYLTIKILIATLVVALCAICSTWTPAYSRLTPLAQGKISALWGKKDYRAAAFYISIELLEQSPSTECESMIDLLKFTYIKAGIASRAIDLNKIQTDERALRNFLTDETSISSPRLVVTQYENGDLLCYSKVDPEVKKRFLCLLPNVVRISRKNTPQYNKVIKRLWWFKPNITTRFSTKESSNRSRNNYRVTCSNSGSLHFTPDFCTGAFSITPESDFYSQARKFVGPINVGQVKLLPEPPFRIWLTDKDLTMQPDNPEE